MLATSLFVTTSTWYHLFVVEKFFFITSLPGDKLVFAGPVHWIKSMTETKLNSTAKDWTASCSCPNSKTFWLPVARFVKKLKVPESSKAVKNWWRYGQKHFCICNSNVCPFHFCHISAKSQQNCLNFWSVYRELKSLSMYAMYVRYFFFIWYNKLYNKRPVATSLDHYAHIVD